MINNFSEEREYPLFSKTCEYLQKSFFYKDIESLVQSIPVNKVVAEKLCEDAFKMCNNNWSLYITKVDSMLTMNFDFLKLQAQLEKDRKYLYSSFDEVDKNFLQKNEKSQGVDYLWGLYFTQIFWVTHHRVFGFFLDSFVKTEDKNGICLDIPCGSGIFLLQFLEANTGWNGVAVDLSDTAISLTENLFNVNNKIKQVSIQKRNFFDFDSSSEFDRIICTEFLEHVEDPLSVLKKLNEILAPSGKVFLTTVVWAAFIDHIYLYRSAEEIRVQIREAGFIIEHEFVQPIFAKDKGKEEGSDIALNYAVLLTKQ